MSPYLWLSPVSHEVLEAILQVHCKNPGKIAMMCSCSHVSDAPYTGITYDTFARARAAYAPIEVERDHLGKNGENIREWVWRDYAEGFTGAMLHVFDPKDALPVMEEYGSKMVWNVGPGEDESRPIDPALWDKTAGLATWFSFPMGPLINGMGNTGRFNIEPIQKSWSAHPDVYIRAHNCDYLTDSLLCMLAQHADGINIAPQLGCLQSLWYLNYAATHGLPIDCWAEECMGDTKNQERWVKRAWEIVPLCGHYHYASIPWRGKAWNECVAYLISAITRMLKVLGC